MWINQKGFQKIMKKYDKRNNLRGTGMELLPEFEKRLEHVAAPLHSAPTRARATGRDAADAVLRRLDVLSGMKLRPPFSLRSDADVVFVNSTCFDDALIGAIAARAEALKKHAFVVTAETLARMKEDGIAPNTIGHNSVVNKLASSGDSVPEHMVATRMGRPRALISPCSSGSFLTMSVNMPWTSRIAGSSSARRTLD